MKWSGYIYLDKTGRIHLLEQGTPVVRTTLDREVKQGYYDATIIINDLTTPRTFDAQYLFSRASVKE